MSDKREVLMNEPVGGPPLTMTVGRTEVTLNGRTQPVHFRHSTADEMVLSQIWAGCDYDVRLLPDPMQDQIDAHYARLERPTIIDGGAHIGLASVWFALAYPKAHVIAVEPHPENFTLLGLNTHGLKVRPVRAALSDRHHLVRVVDEGQGNWGYQIRPAGVGANPSEGGLMAFPVTEFIDPARIFILKMDIEGSEEAVMSTARAWLHQVPVVILEAHGWVPRSCLEPLYQPGRMVEQLGENLCSVRIL
jgi:FkbM family methyltransferase